MNNVKAAHGFAEQTRKKNKKVTNMNTGEGAE